MLAWPEQLDEEGREALGAVMAETPRDSQRMILTAAPGPDLDALLERYAFKAVTFGFPAADAPPAHAEPGPGELRPRAAESARGDAPPDPGRRGSRSRRGGDDRPVPGQPRGGRSAARRAGGRPAAPAAPAGRLIFVVEPVQLGWLRSLFAPLTPLRLPTSLTALEHRAEAARARLERTLASENLDRELFLIGPLLERFDAAEVAAAALRLAGTEAIAQTAEPAGGRPQPEAGSAPGTGVPSWARLWVGVGKKDNVRPGDLLGAIVGETGLAADHTNHNRLAEPSGGDVLAEMIDISDEMAAHEALQAREQLLHRLAEALPIGVFQVLSDGRIAYTNERLQSILGVGPAPTVVDQLATVAREDWPSVEAALEAALGSGIDGDLEIQVRPSDEARTRRCLLRLRALTDGQGAVSGAVVCVEDVTASAQLRAELERRAGHDLLTRLLNRASVLAALEGALASQGRGGTAAIFIDLDDFKGVNDRLGHVAGDELLRTVADRLAITVRSGDPLGRIGGDEFLVVCPGVGGPQPALAVAERIAHALRQPVRLAGATLELRASVGVAYAGRRVRADLLVRRADAAMYRSKHRGEGRPVVYSSAVARASGAGGQEAPRP